jgi:hypothetical protein
VSQLAAVEAAGTTARPRSCQARVEIDDESVGTERTDPRNVAYRYECGNTFDYDDQEVIEAPAGE